MANSKTIRAADGGYLLDAEQFKYTKDELGRPVLTVHGAALGGGDFMASGKVAMEGNLQMSGNAILGVKSISNTDSGLAIESEVDLNNHRITGLLDPVEPQDAATRAYVDASAFQDAQGKATGNLDMNEHSITNAHKISTDGVAPLYIGSTIETGDVTSPRLTATSDGQAAFVKANTQSTYVPVHVGTPTASSHAAPKVYVDSKCAAMFPPITDAANGKVLGVVDGQLAWVAKA